jgi:hypothetical protein
MLNRMNTATLFQPNNIDIETLNNISNLSSSICNLALKCQKQIFVLSNISSIIECNCTDSFIIDRTCVIFPNYKWNNKFNHLTLSNIYNTHLFIDGAISGIDIIECKNIVLNIISDTYINIENSLNINITGPVIVEASHSVDIILNNYYLPINVFSRSHRYQTNLDCYTHN